MEVINMTYNGFEKRVRVRNNDKCEFTVDEYTEIIEPVYEWIGCFSKEDIADMATAISKEKVLNMFSAMLTQVEIEKEKDSQRRQIRAEITKKREELKELEMQYNNI